MSSRLADHVTRLGALLRRWRALWEPRPFAERVLPWEADHPELSRWVRALPDAGLRRLERARVPRLAHAPWQAELVALTRLPALSRARLPAAPPDGLAMPRRKWAQVRALAGVALAGHGDGRLRDRGSRWVDACAGKGYLGRSLALLDGRSSLALERRPDLCAAGARIAAQAGADCTFVAVDVEDPGLVALLAPGDVITALHACGRLTDALVRQGDAAGVAGLVIAPCCCHVLVDERAWLPLSEPGSAVAPTPLTSAHLRLATADEVGPPAGTRLRRMAFRLAMDELLPSPRSGLPRAWPRVPERLLAGPFADYARAVAEQAGVALPARWSAGDVEAAGWRRVAEVRRLDLVRLQFRRALELFVWLDRARWLEERGWEARLGTFCPAAATPRNLGLVAVR